MHRLKNHFAPGGMLHYGQGKWYPGEPLPRWALNIFWRVDGQPMWLDATLFSDEHVDDGYGPDEADRFCAALARALAPAGRQRDSRLRGRAQQAQREQGLPVNLDPLKADLKAPDERRRLARLLERGLGQVAGYVLPLKARGVRPAIVMLGTELAHLPWPIRREHLYLIDGDSPIGLRLPLNTLPWVLPEEREPSSRSTPSPRANALPVHKRDRRPILGLGAGKSAGKPPANKAPATPAEPARGHPYGAVRRSARGPPVHLHAADASASRITWRWSPPSKTPLRS
jgi:uncharacterized protein (DUF2126 family)